MRKGCLLYCVILFRKTVEQENGIGCYEEECYMLGTLLLVNEVMLNCLFSLNDTKYLKGKA
jgi:hypothetical protein